MTALIIATLVPPSWAADGVSETRTVSPFDSIRLQGAFTAEITVGTSPPRVVVSAERDLIGRIATDVQGRTLIVRMRSGYQSSGRAPKLTIAIRALRRFTNEGAGSANISGLTGGDVLIENDGAASIVASGRAARETISLDGSGKIDTTNVAARDVTINSNGFGSIHVRASGQLTMNMNGIGEILYTGNPSHVESHVDGIGHIGRL